MKKSLFLIPCLAAALWSCSDKDVVGPQEGPNNGEVEYNYLAVDVVPANNTGSRAEDDFKTGSDIENQVNSIRFYFFDYEGKAIAVKSNGNTYYDAQTAEFTQTPSTETPGPVEKVVSAIVVIESQKGDKKPAYMVAVLNHNGKAPVLTPGQPISYLQGLDGTTNYDAAINNYSEHTIGKFTMSSSVYKGDKTTYQPADGYTDSDSNKDLTVDPSTTPNQEIVAVPVYENIKTTREDALKNKATIYVERVLAKVETKLGLSNPEVGSGLYEVGHIGNAMADNVTEDEKIYVKFLGWNVTADRKKSRLVKKINTAWADPFDGWAFSWNDYSKNSGTGVVTTNYRSYWAVNPINSSSAPIETEYNFGKFAEKNTSGSYAPDQSEEAAWSFDFSDNNYTYIHENAGKADGFTTALHGTLNDVATTKVIVAAQLVDKSGNPLELVKWQGDVYKKNAALMKKLAADTHIYKRAKNQNGDETWTLINDNDVELKYTQVEGGADGAANTSSPRYYVTLELTQTDQYDYAVYTGSIQGEGNEDGLDKGTPADGKYPGYPASDNKIKAALASVGNIMYWNSGYTYYWVDINHFGTGNVEEGKTAVGKLGIVRNHWYEITFTKVTGLGVPVANPDEIIYPETPQPEDLFYLAAEIKILQWRMVKQSAELGW